MELQIVKYDINKAEIAKMSNIYLKLTINDLENKEEFDQVHSARMTMVTHRTSVNKLRLSANRNAQDFIKKNNKDAQELIALMEPVETHLLTQEKRVTDEQSRIKEKAAALEKEKINKRVMALFSAGVNIPYFDVAMLTDAEYSELFDNSKTKYDAGQKYIAEEEAAQKAEAERLKSEAERLKKIQEVQEAEMKEKLAAQETKLEEIRLEQEKTAATIADKEKALEQEREAIEAEKQKELERKNRVAFEKVALAEAKIKAEKDAIAKAEREAREKKEREAAEVAEKVRQEAEKKRQAGIAPDREKLLDLAMTIRQIISPPAIKDEIAKEIVETILVALSIIADNLVIQAGKL